MRNYVRPRIHYKSKTSSCRIDGFVLFVYMLCSFLCECVSRSNVGEFLCVLLVFDDIWKSLMMKMYIYYDYFNVLISLNVLRWFFFLSHYTIYECVKVRVKRSIICNLNKISTIKLFEFVQIRTEIVKCKQNYYIIFYSEIFRSFHGYIILYYWHTKRTSKLTYTKT